RRGPPLGDRLLDVVRLGLAVAIDPLLPRLRRRQTVGLLEHVGQLVGDQRGARIAALERDPVAHAVGARAELLVRVPRLVPDDGAPAPGALSPPVKLLRSLSREFSGPPAPLPPETAWSAGCSCLICCATCRFFDGATPGSMRDIRDSLSPSLSTGSADGSRNF